MAEKNVRQRLLKHLDLLPDNYESALKQCGMLLAYVYNFCDKPRESMIIQDDKGLNIRIDMRIMDYGGKLWADKFSQGRGRYIWMMKNE